MLKLAEKYAKLKKAKVLAHRISDNGKEITFVLSTGQKLTMTESQLNLAIAEIQKTDSAGTVGGDEESVAASPESASRAPKTKTKKEG